MPNPLSLEPALLAALQTPEAAGPEVATALQALQRWRTARLSTMAGHRLDEPVLRPRAEAARQAQAINQALADLSRQEAEQWAGLDPARRVAEHFDGQVMLLIFGKFNAGKSSLCNLLAERLQRHGVPAQFFQCDAQGITPRAQALQEGATETTQQLQGVQLGRRLVLLDTPGLHSMSADNAALTRRYLDSADGVLWLTSSTSPGQVQELEELGHELLRGKPLLPVITRSDCYEEDEVDGDIVKRLCNKSAANRREQEDDVRDRAADKLRVLGIAPARLLPPVSLSARMAREPQAGDPTGEQARQQAGIERLYAALLRMIQPVLAYQARKPAEVLLHHNQERLVQATRQQLTPRLQALHSTCAAAQSDWQALAPAMIKAGLKRLLPALPGWLQGQVEHPDPERLRAELSAALGQAFSAVAQTMLPDVILQPTPALATLSMADLAWESMPPDSDPWMHYTHLEQCLRARLGKLSEDALAQSRQALARLQQQADALQAAMACSDQELATLRDALRARRSAD